MNKDGSTAAAAGKSRLALTTLRIMSKEGRILRITLPREISIACGSSPRLLRNLATIASNRSGRSLPKADGRATLRYRRLYRLGFPLNKLLPLAAKTLDRWDFDVLARSCVREMNEKKAEITWPDFDVAICFLDAAGALSDCTAEAAAKHVTSFLHKHGIPQNLTADAYRKRVKRLRSIGVRLGPDK